MSAVPPPARKYGRTDRHSARAAPQERTLIHRRAPRAIGNAMDADPPPRVPAQIDVSLGVPGGGTPEPEPGAAKAGTEEEKKRRKTKEKKAKKTPGCIPQLRASSKQWGADLQIKSGRRIFLRSNVSVFAPRHGVARSRSNTRGNDCCVLLLDRATPWRGATHWLRDRGATPWRWPARAALPRTAQIDVSLEVPGGDIPEPEPEAAKRFFLCEEEAQLQGEGIDQTRRPVM